MHAEIDCSTSTFGILKLKKLIVLALFSVAFSHGAQSAGGGLVTDDEKSLSGIARTVTPRISQIRRLSADRLENHGRRHYIPVPSADSLRRRQIDTMRIRAIRHGARNDGGCHT